MSHNAGFRRNYPGPYIRMYQAMPCRTHGPISTHYLMEQSKIEDGKIVSWKCLNCWNETARAGSLNDAEGGGA